jgi:hypothetical protein
MSTKMKSDRLTPRTRLARGLKYSTVGPVDVTRGALGIGLGSAHASAAWVGNRYRRGRIAGQLRKDLAAAQATLGNELVVAQEVVANLPRTLKDARRAKRRPRPWVLVTAGVAVLGVGAVAFSIVRRSTQPDPSPLPPSVEVSPKP